MKKWYLVAMPFRVLTLADLSAHDPALRRQTITILEQVTTTGSPAVKSRGRKLLQQLTTQQQHEERKTT